MQCNIRFIRSYVTDNYFENVPFFQVSLFVYFVLVFDGGNHPYFCSKFCSFRQRGRVVKASDLKIPRLKCGFKSRFDNQLVLLAVVPSSSPRLRL